MMIKTILKKISIILAVVGAMFFTLNVSVLAMNVDLPFEYYTDSLIYARANNGEVTVEAGANGMIWVTPKGGERQEVKYVCFESIYWLEYIDGEFVAFSDTYKLTSKDGYNWAKTEDPDDIERKKYSVSESNKSIEFIKIEPQFQTNKFSYKREDGKDADVEILYTGKEYLKTEKVYGLTEAKYDVIIYKSYDRENWEYVKTDPYISSWDGDVLPFPGLQYETSKQIINTGKEYLVRNTKLDNKLNVYNQTHRVIVYDLDFNFVKRIKFDDFMNDMSYIDGVCYITTEDCITYKSTDLENWEVIGENIGAPMQNSVTTIYKTRLQIVGGPRGSNMPFCYEGPIVYQNGNPIKNVIEEGIELYGTRVYGDFFVGYDNRNSSKTYVDDSEIKGLDGNFLDVKRKSPKNANAQFSFSKDGIYWATQELPVNFIESIDCTNDTLLVTSGLFIFSFKFSDMEKVVPKSDIRVELNNRVLGFEVPPMIEEDRTLVPIRFLFEQMGAEVDWVQETETATIHKQGQNVTFAIDDNTASVNGVSKTMDVPARLIDGRTLVPLRFISENLGYDVEWDENTNTAIITTDGAAQTSSNNPISMVVNGVKSLFSAK